MRIGFAVESNDALVFFLWQENLVFGASQSELRGTHREAKTQNCPFCKLSLFWMFFLINWLTVNNTSEVAVNIIPIRKLVNKVLLPRQPRQDAGFNGREVGSIEDFAFRRHDKAADDISRHGLHGAEAHLDKVDVPFLDIGNGILWLFEDFRAG